MGTVHIDSPPIVWKCDARVYHTKTKFTIFWQPCIKNRTQAGKIPPVCMPWLKPRAGGSQKILTVSLVIYFPALCKPIKINKTSLNCGGLWPCGWSAHFSCRGLFALFYSQWHISNKFLQSRDKFSLSSVSWKSSIRLSVGGALSVVPLAMKNPFVKWLINQVWAGKPLPFFFESSLPMKNGG